MFNKKRKAAEKQARLAQRAQVEDQFAEEIAAVEEIKDPAARILKLVEIENKAIQYVRNNIVVKSTGAKAALRNIGMIYMGSLAVMVPLTIVAPHVAGAAVIAAGLGGSLGGDVADGILAGRKLKARQAEVEAHLNKVLGFQAQARDIKWSLVENEAEQITQSPLYERILRVPSLAAAFDGAAAKQVEKLKKEAEAVKKASRQRQQKATPRPSLDRYDRLKDPFGYKK